MNRRDVLKAGAVAPLLLTGCMEKPVVEIPKFKDDWSRLVITFGRRKRMLGHGRHDMGLIHMSGEVYITIWFLGKDVGYPKDPLEPDWSQVGTMGKPLLVYYDADVATDTGRARVIENLERLERRVEDFNERDRGKVKQTLRIFRDNDDMIHRKPATYRLDKFGRYRWASNKQPMWDIRYVKFTGRYV